MLGQLLVPLTAKLAHVLRVLLICRVSCPGVGKQDIRSLTDQEQMLREWLQRHTSLPVEVEVVAGQGSGEIIDRPEVLKAEQEVATGRYDLVLTEDLGRIMRRMHALVFCELALDFETRVIAINDNLDTGVDGWRLHACFASMRHEMYNADTGKRIRRTQRARFMEGGIIQCPIYGYIKPYEKCTDAQLVKDPAAEAVYDEWFHRLEAGQGYSQIADWLNSLGIKPGPYTRSNTWTCAMVGRCTRNPILKGLRVRNAKISKRVSSGRRKTVAAPPSERLERHCPHLAFIEPDRYDRVIDMLTERNEVYARSDDPATDCRRGVPRKRVRYPGQCIYCGVCGRMFVFGGHGQTNHLMCDGARQYACWNGATVDGELAAQKLTAAVLLEIEALSGFDEFFLSEVQGEARRLEDDKSKRLEECQRQIKELSVKIDRLVGLAMDGKAPDSINLKIGELEKALQNVERERDRVQRRKSSSIELPEMDELKLIAREKLAALAIDSFDFADFLRQLTPRVVVHPYQLIDGGHVVLRAEFELELAALIEEENTREAARSTLKRTLRLDLFENPQREHVREAVVSARRRGIMENEIAKTLGITTTAASRAMKLQRLMESLGLDDPYHLLMSPPEGGKLRRHLHPRYDFRPLMGP